MTAEEFRRLALGLEGAVEASHMNHPDFRVNHHIFATLGPDESWGMVKLPIEVQAELVEKKPAVFQPASGAWGRQGATIVQLATAPKTQVRNALKAAWMLASSKRPGRPPKKK